HLQVARQEMSGGDGFAQSLAGADRLHLFRVARDRDRLDLGLGLVGRGLELGKSPGALRPPSTTTCPKSPAAMPLRASAAIANAKCVASRARARFAATAAARRMPLRVTSPAFPNPTSRTRSGLAPPG